MLGERIVDPVESGMGEVPGLGLLPVVTEFLPDKLLALRHGRCPKLAVEGGGYEIRHGRLQVHGGEPMFESDAGAEGCVLGAIWGTSWHGTFENDAFRRAFLTSVADGIGVPWRAGDVSFLDAREAQAARLGRLMANHSDTAGLMELIAQGPMCGLPVVNPGGVP